MEDAGITALPRLPLAVQVIGVLHERRGNVSSLLRREAHPGHRRAEVDDDRAVLGADGDLDATLVGRRQAPARMLADLAESLSEQLLELLVELVSEVLVDLWAVVAHGAVSY